MARDQNDGEWSCCCERTPTGKICFNFLATVLLFLVLLGLLLYNRYAFLRLAAGINVAQNDTIGNAFISNDLHPQPVESKKVETMLLVILMLPCAVNVLRSLPEVLLGCRLGKEKNNSTSEAAAASQATRSDSEQANTSTTASSRSCREKACFWFSAIFTPILETLGVTLFCFKVIPNYNSVTQQLLMTSLVLFPTRALGLLRQSQCCTQKSCIVEIVGFAVQLGALVLAVIAPVKSPPKVSFWYMLLAWLFLIVSWTIYPKAATRTTENLPSFTRRDMELKDNVFAWQLSFSTNFIKLLFIPLFTFVFCYLDNSLYDQNGLFWEDMLADFRAAWEWRWGTETQLALGLVLCGSLAYLLALWTCQLRVARFALVPPIFLSLILQGIFGILNDWCLLTGGIVIVNCDSESGPSLMILATVLGILGQVLSLGKDLWWDSHTALQQESVVFYLPGFQFFALEQWLMKNRTCRATEGARKGASPNATVFICTTMHREGEHEMKTLLKSIAAVDDHQWGENRCFESHIILDSGARGDRLTPFARQLVSLLPSTLYVKIPDAQKQETPYGLRLRWTLPEKHGHLMSFCIHLKDPRQVKKKKRWSQILYLRFILDWLIHKGGRVTGAETTKKPTLEDSYILVTDGDVEFNPDSVEKLLHLMLRDSTVGAVCARVHPKGSGLLYWIQIFEYAIGHWFQKAAEHILGSVLCAPGCFSVYRCQALRDVLPTYASNVDEAFDFLTKDMGEDRWLCTLMIQAGWRIDYCAAASCRTYCPEDFDEFFKQRRRWIASTLANLKLLLSRGMEHSRMKAQWLFKAFQGLLLVSAIVSPSTVILLVAGGLWYAWNVNPVAMVIVQVLVCAAFTFVCLYTSSTVQLNAAKLLIFLYAVTMTAVVVGTAQEIIEDVKIHNATGQLQTLPEVQHMGFHLPLSTTTLYLAAISALFLVTAVLHLSEVFCLIPGLIYILVLPSFSIILNIYCLVNITDKSWGTREEKMRVFGNRDKVPLLTRLWNAGRKLKLFIKQHQEEEEEETQIEDVQLQSFEGACDDREVQPAKGMMLAEWLCDSFSPDLQSGSVHEHPAFSIAAKFREHGFDNTIFISGMNERELRRIGITEVGMIQFLMKKIETLETFEINVEIPTTVEEWLMNIGLEQYYNKFQQAFILEPNDLAVLKRFSPQDIKRELKIRKAGHIKRLQYAIKQLREPTTEERAANEVQENIQEMKAGNLKKEQRRFWNPQAIKSLPQPALDAFRIEGDLHRKLGKLRNSWLMILGVINILWVVLITTLASKLDLVVLGANPMGLLFLMLFGLVFAVQFVCMLMHRLHSLSHWLASADYSCSCCKCCTTSASNGEDVESSCGSCCLRMRSCCCCLQHCCHDRSYTRIEENPD